MRRLVQAFVLLSMTTTAHTQDTGRVRQQQFADDQRAKRRGVLFYF